MAVCAAPARGAAPFAPWSESGFASAEQRVLGDREIYAAGRPGLPFRVDATVLFARRTSWTQARAIRQVRRTASILGSCGIAFGRVRLVRLTLDPSHRRIDASRTDPATGVPGVVAELAGRLPPGTDYPAAFLVGRIDGLESLAVSYRAPEGTEASAAYLDTAWISYPAHWRQRADDRYSVLAHEFAHLLCRCGHTPSATRHLLHESRNFLSSTVLDEHCERFRSSPLVSASR